MSVSGNLPRRIYAYQFAVNATEKDFMAYTKKADALNHVDTPGLVGTYVLESVDEVERTTKSR
jgi:hypothetical protein